MLMGWFCFVISQFERYVDVFCFEFIICLRAWAIARFVRTTCWPENNWYRIFFEIWFGLNTNFCMLYFVADFPCFEWGPPHSCGDYFGQNAKGADQLTRWKYKIELLKLWGIHDLFSRINAGSDIVQMYNIGQEMDKIHFVRLVSTN